MFFRRRSAEGDVTPLRLGVVRDIVEIVAIVAAGVWASYTFVYENQIKPANVGPQVILESSLSRLGERKGLIAVQSRVSIRNAGTTGVWIYGFAETVSATTVSKRTADATPQPDPRLATLSLQADWTESRSVPVYDIALLTNLANATSKNTFNLLPGQTGPFDRVFYVRADRYDKLQTHVSLRYSNRREPQPFRLEIDRDGIVSVVPENPSGEEIEGIDTTTATLALWR